MDKFGRHAMVALSIITALGLLIVYSTLTKAQDITQGSGIFCSDPGQLERVISHAERLGNVLNAVAATNEEVGGEQACGVATVIGIFGKGIKTLNSPEGLLDIVPVQVNAYRTPLGAKDFDEPPTWYTLAASDKRGA